MLRALARRREERYPTARDLQIAIEEYAREAKLTLSSVALARLMVDVLGEPSSPSAPVASSPPAPLPPPLAPVRPAVTAPRFPPPVATVPPAKPMWDPGSVLPPVVED